MDWLHRLFSSDGFMPHGHCYLWRPEVLWLHVLSDGLIFLAYVTIPITLVYFIRKRKDLPFDWMFFCFGVFIVACGTTHAMEIWTLWTPVYWLAGVIKAITAAASVITAVLLVRLVPRALAIPSPEALRVANAQLRRSESIYRTLARNFPKGSVLLFDGDLRCLVAEGEALADRGLTSKTLEGRRITDVLPEVVGAKLEVLYRGALAGRSQTTEFEQNGHTYSVQTLPAHDENGKIFGGMAVAQDITERSRYEKLLRENEERQRLLLDSLQDYAIVSLDVEGTITSWNAGSERIFGYSAAEVMGRPFPDLYRTVASGSDSPLALAREQNRFESELWGERKDGSAFWSNLIISPIRGEDGRLRGFSTITRDLTERKAAERRLRQSDERFRLMLESVRDYAIITLDPKGVVTAWNAGAERFKGYRADEIVGQHFSRFYSESDVRGQRPEALLELALSSGRAEEDGWRIRKDGSRFWANVTISAARDEDGVVVGFVKVTRDLTERKRAEDEALALMSRLEESNRELESFASVASHDLQEPLRKIRAFGDRLQTRYTNELGTEGGDYIARMISAAARMQTLIDNLLTFSRVSTKFQPFVLVDLNQVARDVITDLEVRVSQTAATVNIQSLPTIEGDATQLRQLLQNLIGNALKFHGDKPPTVTVSAASAVTTSGLPAVELRVVDNGIGFEAQYAERIFGIFQRLHARTEYEGTGIGLAICRKIVSAARAPLWRDRSGVGTVTGDDGRSEERVAETGCAMEGEWRERGRVCSP